MVYTEIHLIGYIIIDKTLIYKV